jgi:hypothetical protein
MIKYKLAEEYLLFDDFNTAVTINSTCSSNLTPQSKRRCAPLEGYDPIKHSHCCATLLSVEGPPGFQNSMSRNDHHLSRCEGKSLGTGRQAALIPRASHALAPYTRIQKIEYQSWTFHMNKKYWKVTYLAMRQSHSAQSDVWVAIVDPSLDALRPTAIDVHLSEMMALGSDAATDLTPTEHIRVIHKRNFEYIFKFSNQLVQV